MKISKSYKRLLMWAAGAVLAYGCASDQQEQEDIVYSDQPQQQEQQQQEQQEDYAQADDSSGGESALDESEGAEGEDLVSSYQEELSSDDTPSETGIADSGAQTSPGNETNWNSGTNDYNSSEGDSYAGTGSAASDGSSQPTDPSLNYTTEPAYDTSADAGTTASTGYQGSGSSNKMARKNWKKKKSSNWKKPASQSYSAGGYNDNLSTDLTGNQRLYIVQRGDTLSSIAHKIYGDAALWNELAATNGISNANTIYPGDPIKFASNAYSKDFEATYDNIAKNTITVQSGDTLSSIAQQVFGDSGEWKVLYTMNKSEIADPNTISPNQVLYYFTRQSFNQAFMQSSIKERFGH